MPIFCDSFLYRAVMSRTIFTAFLLLCILFANAQVMLHSIQAKKNGTTLFTSDVQMPYNRLIHSAGKVITYGNPDLENHALDLTVLPDKKYIAIEDRYGIAIFDAKTNMIKTRWMFADSSSYKDLLSTYSGITSFVYNKVNYVVWGTQGEEKGYNLSCASQTFCFPSNSNTMNIRLANKKDAKAIFCFIQELEEANFDSSLFERYYAMNLANENCIYLVAEID